MTKRAIAILVMLGIVGIGSGTTAYRRDILVSFDDGIGVDPGAECRRADER